MALRRTLIVLASGIAAAGAGFAALAAPASAATTATPTPASCDRAPWQSRVQGTPTGVTSGSRGGDYLWHNATGFHLVVTHAGDARQLYTGQITSATAMKFEPVKLEKGDSVTLSANHRTLTFVFANYGHIDGLNFHTYCSPSITLKNLTRGNAKLTTDRVYLGASKVHPAKIPFTITRLLTPSS